MAIPFSVGGTASPFALEAVLRFILPVSMWLNLIARGTSEAI